eukprot:9986362-Lingulodinium_polyedra.AAC.1
MQRVFQRRTLGTHVSGLGTVELAVAMLDSAAQHVMRSPLRLSSAFACDSATQDLLVQRFRG